MLCNAHWRRLDVAPSWGIPWYGSRPRRGTEMPITPGPAIVGFTLYYALAGNNNKTNLAGYRSNNPWQSAKAFCHDLPTSHPNLVAHVTTLDDSVYQVTLAGGALSGTATLKAIATSILNDLANRIAPAVNGDKLVAVIPDQGTLVELVHHTP